MEESEEEDDSASSALSGRVALVRGPNGQTHRIPISVLLRLMQANDEEEEEAESQPANEESKEAESTPQPKPDDPLVDTDEAEEGEEDWGTSELLEESKQE